MMKKTRIRLSGGGATEPPRPLARLRIKIAAALAIAATAAILIVPIGNAESYIPPAPDDDEPVGTLPLSSVPVPGPSAAQLKEFVRDRNAAIQLGKALFWDSRVGSDNKTACASCHFHAGADNRIRNQINPGTAGNDKRFSLGGPNTILTAADFPLTRFSSLNEAGYLRSDTNDVVASQGVFSRSFNSVSAKGEPDDCTTDSIPAHYPDSGFQVGGILTRQVEPRNAPSVFNAVFNFRNFWDGRANNVFNGIDIFGLRNAEARVYKLQYGQLNRIKIEIPSSSLASLAVGPPLSEVEMSCRGRTFPRIGKKLLNTRPLADQTIARDDSVLGFLSDVPAPYGYQPVGKTETEQIIYADLVKKAFQPEYWESKSSIYLAIPEEQIAKNMDLKPVTGTGALPAYLQRERFSQMEANFSLFFGLAIQLYQSTLITDQTPFDRYAAGDKRALSSQQVRGLAIFNGAGRCVHCHSGAELTSASFTSLAEEGRLDQRAGAQYKIFRYDNGFFNNGARPTSNDIGVAGVDPFGNSFSETRLAQLGKFELLGNGFDIRREVPVAPGAPLAIEGAMKTPGLRNVELTGPYFHNGGKSTLMQVVDAYNRGGDFGRINQPVTDPAIEPLGLTQSQKEDLVAFLISLTDERVRFRKAPFDHPSICIPHGHVGDAKSVTPTKAGTALGFLRCLSEVGAAGTREPLARFLDLDPFGR